MPSSFFDIDILRIHIIILSILLLCLLIHQLLFSPLHILFDDRKHDKNQICYTPQHSSVLFYACVSRMYDSPSIHSLP